MTCRSVRGRRLRSGLNLLLLGATTSVQGACLEEPVASESSEPNVLIDNSRHAFLTESPEGSVIRTIEIANNGIFDTDDPRQSGWIHRLMNTVHVETHQDVVRRQLLIQPGDPYSERLVDESARLLRQNSYLAEAKITPIDCEAGYVDLAVQTTDAWSLTPSISFSRTGGQDSGGIEIEESNLFGRGSEIEIGYKSDVDRDTMFLEYHDSQIGDSRVQIDTLFSENSDGSRYALELVRPFYAMDARRAHGVRLSRFDQIDSLYQLGAIVGEIQHEGRHGEMFFGWSKGLQSGFARRWIIGFGYDEHRFENVSSIGSSRLSLPARRDVYPFFGFEWLEDVDQIHRLEDRYLGTRIVGQLGYATGVFGSETEAVRLRLSAHKGYRPFDGDTLLLRSRVEARWPNEGSSSYLFDADARYFHRQSEKRLFAAQLSVAAGGTLDTDSLITLGGDTGLRAYPLRYLNGDRKVLLSLEQRFYTDWYPFHLFRVGAAVFFDAGKMWGSETPAEASLGILRDVGVGLRIGSPHSSSGRMLHIDIAYPMDGPPVVRGPQLYIETRKQF